MIADLYTRFQLIIMQRKAESLRRRHVSKLAKAEKLAYEAIELRQQAEYIEHKHRALAIQSGNWVGVE